MDKGTVIRINNAHKAAQASGGRSCWSLRRWTNTSRVSSITFWTMISPASRIVRLMKYECTIVGHVQDRVTATLSDEVRDALK